MLIWTYIEFPNQKNIVHILTPRLLAELDFVDCDAARTLCHRELFRPFCHGYVRSVDGFKVHHCVPDGYKVCTGCLRIVRQEYNFLQDLDDEGEDLDLSPAQVVYDALSGW